MCLFLPLSFCRGMALLQLLLFRAYEKFGENLTNEQNAIHSLSKPQQPDEKVLASCKNRH